VSLLAPARTISEARDHAGAHPLARDEAFGMADEFVLEPDAFLRRQECGLDRYRRRVEDGIEGKAVEPCAYFREGVGLSAPPGRYRRQVQFAAEQVPRELGEERREGWRLRDRRAGHIYDRDVVGPHGLHQPRGAERRVFAQF